MRPSYIYLLEDPRVSGDMSCRYVGKSVNIRRRVKVHINAARKGERRHVSSWIKSLLEIGLLPRVVIVMRCASNEEANEAERQCISQMTAMGCNLTNLTPGGDGRSGFRHSEETKAKIAAGNKGKKLSEDTRAKLSLSKAGEKNPFYGKAGSSHPGFGYERSLETRAKMSEAVRVCSNCGARWHNRRRCGT